jgi:Tetratricopeptide repeat
MSVPMHLKFGLCIFLVIFQTTCLSELASQSGISHHRFGTSHRHSAHRHSGHGTAHRSHNHSQFWHGNRIYRNSHSFHHHVPHNGSHHFGPYSNYRPFYRSYYGKSFYQQLIAPPIYSAPLPSQSQRFTDPRNGLQNLSKENRNQWKELLENQTRSLGSQQSNRKRNSTTAQESRSFQYYSKGNLALKKKRYSEAIHHYSNAIYLTPNQSKPHLHIGLAYTGLRNYLKAIVHLKKAVILDPSIPSTGQDLIEIFGPENQSELFVIKQQVVKWADKNIQDPQRLFLLGFILHFSGSQKQAASLFEAAVILSGKAEHLIPFRDYYQKLPPEKRENINPVPNQPSKPVNQPLSKTLPLPPEPGIIEKEQPKKVSPLEKEDSVPFLKPKPQKEKRTAPKKDDKNNQKDSGPILIKPGV